VDNNKRLAILILPVLITCSALTSALGLAPATAQTKPNSSKKFKHDARITQIYDKAQDQTIVVLEPYPLVVDPANNFDFSELAMKVYFKYPGTTPRPPESVTFDFVWSGYDFRFEKRTKVTVKLDGKQVDLGEAERVAARGAPEGGEDQRLVLFVPYDLFTRIINTRSDRVELHMRGYFYFDKQTLEALRHVASRAHP
jgi:hypothetical protein